MMLSVMWAVMVAPIFIVSIAFTPSGFWLAMSVTTTWRVARSMDVIVTAAVATSSRETVALGAAWAASGASRNRAAARGAAARAVGVMVAPLTRAASGSRGAGRPAGR